MSTALAEAIELADLDLKPSAVGDTAPGGCQFPGCTNGLKTNGGRGRPPKFCEEHKGGKAVPGAFNVSKSALNGRSWPRAAEIETLLTNHVKMLGAGLTLINEADGEIIATGGPEIVHELVELGKTDRGMRVYLEKLAAPGKYAPLIMAIAGVAMPIMANHGIMPTINLKLPVRG